MLLQSKRGEVVTIVILVLALIGGGLWVSKPKWLHGETKRAVASEKATVAVDKAIEKVDSTQNQQAASAAAKVAVIATANGMAPDSPSKAFIAQEAQSALADLPKPDPMALLAAEQRRSAVMEGRADEARKLYEQEAAKASKLQQERDVSIAARDHAMEARRTADNALLEAAAAHRAQGQQMAALGLVALLLGGLWLYTKLTHLSPSGIGKLAFDLRNGFDPITALSIHTPPWIHDTVQSVVKQAANLDQPKP